MRKETVKLDIVAGVEGNSIYLNDFRIAGPKPWGGGKVISSWDVRPSDIYKALAAPEPLVKESRALGLEK